MQAIYLREAEIELIKSATFYEEKSAGLGAEFINEVNSTVQLIKKMPEASPLINSYARKALLNRFEYGIVYRIFNNLIVILAVMHSKREPNYWIGRK